MPSFVLKASPDEDLYCIYSTTVDAVVFIGTRGETRQHLLYEDGSNGRPDERLERADETGSSCREPGYGWDAESLWIGEGPGHGHLPRASLSEYLQALLVHDIAAAEDLVKEQDHA